MVTVKKGVRVAIVIAILLLLALLLFDRYERGSVGAVSKVAPVVRIDSTRMLNLQTGEIWSSLPGQELVALVPLREHHFVFSSSTIYSVDAAGDITAIGDAGSLGLDEITDVVVTPTDDGLDIVIVGDPVVPPADPGTPYVEIDGTIDPGGVTPEDITPVPEPTVPAGPASVPDMTAPVITILGANPASIVAGSTYVDAGATALDDVDGDVTGAIVVSGSVDTGTPGTYVIIYAVSDAAGNTAVAIRNVDVVEPPAPEPTPTPEPVPVPAPVPDTSPPVITILGANPAIILEGTRYVDAGATALDAEDGDLTSAIVTTSTVDATMPGTYAVLYAVSDSAGNTAATVRTVVVVAVPPSGDVFTPVPDACSFVTTGSDGLVYAISPTATTVIDPSLLAFHYAATDAELATYLAATRPFLTLDEGTLTLIAYRLPDDLSTFEAAIESTCDSPLTFTTLTTTDALTRDEFLVRIADPSAAGVTVRELSLTTGTTFVSGAAPTDSYVYMKADAGPCTAAEPAPIVPDACPPTGSSGTPTDIPTGTTPTSTPICPPPTAKLIAHTCTADTTTAPGAPYCYYYPAGAGTTGHVCDIPGTVTYGCYPSTGGVEGPGCGDATPCASPGFYEIRPASCAGTCAENDGGLNPGLKGSIILTMPATTSPSLLTTGTDGTTYSVAIAPSPAVTTVADSAGAGSTTKTTLNDHCINPDGSVAEYSYLLREYVCSGSGGEYVDIACPCQDPLGGPDHCFQLVPGEIPPWFVINPPPNFPQWQQQQQPPQYTQ